MLLFARALAILAVTLLCTVAQAQDRLARTHYEAGSSYYQQGRYADALREFEEAYRLSSAARKPALLYNIGQAHERLNRLADAIDAFRRYLEASPGADDAEVVRERINTLQARLEGTAITLQVSEAGAHVLVDGEDRGTTPLAEPARVGPGPHEVRIEKPGFQTFSVRVTVPAGETVSVEANLVASAASSSGAPAPEPTPDTLPAAGAGTGGGPGLLPWVLVGVAGATAIAGGVFGVLALGKRDDANALAHGDAVAYDDARSSAKGLALAADVSFGVAAVAATIGIVILVTAGGEDEPPASARAGATVLPVALRGGAGVVIGGSL